MYSEKRDDGIPIGVPEYLSQRRNWIPPPPIPPQASVSPCLPAWTQGGEQHSFVGEGGPNSGDIWEKEWHSVYSVGYLQSMHSL
jgi:hypothetical protein